MTSEVIDPYRRLGDATLTDRPLALAVIIGSTREGRIGPKIAGWFTGQIESREEFNLDVIDLADLDLPLVLRRHCGPAVDAYLERLNAADAFVIVTPEYNHGYPASLKQAIDVAHTQWQTKPIAFVSYGGIAGGVRAVEQLRQVFVELHALTVRDCVSFHRPWQLFGEDGSPRDGGSYEITASRMLERLSWWARALRIAREQDAYPQFPPA